MTKTTLGSRRLPVMSLSLLLVAYTSFGWSLISPDSPRSRWLLGVCGFLAKYVNLHFLSPVQELSYCRQFVEQNWIAVVLSIIWIFLSSLAFRSPLTSFTRLITRSFHSDTVAFLSIFIAAGMAAIVLFWLHVFLFILTILAAEALARIDIQLAGFSVTQAFWMLLSVCLVGLGLGVSTHYFHLIG